MARLTLTAPQYANLLALGDPDDVLLIVSSTSPDLGLGSLVPEETDENGDPAPGTAWFTAHPDGHRAAAAVLPKLEARLRFAATPRNRTAIRAIVADMETARNQEDPSPIPTDELRTRFAAAGGDISDPRPPEVERMRVARING